MAQHLYPALKDCSIQAAEDDSVKACCQGGSRREGEGRKPGARGVVQFHPPVTPCTHPQLPSLQAASHLMPLLRLLLSPECHSPPCPDDKCLCLFGDLALGLFSEDFPNLPSDGIAIPSYTPSRHYMNFCLHTDKCFCQTGNP